MYHIPSATLIAVIETRGGTQVVFYKFRFNCTAFNMYTGLYSMHRCVSVHLESIAREDYGIDYSDCSSPNSEQGYSKSFGPSDMYLKVVIGA